MKGKVIAIYTVTGAVLAVKAGFPVLGGIVIGLAFSSIVIGLGLLLNIRD